MKRSVRNSTTIFCATLLLALAASAAAYGQEPARLQLDSLNHLENRADQTINVTVDGKILQLAISFLSSKDPDEAKVKELVAGLKGIYVKIFDFEKENEYTPADIEAVRSQLRSPLWSRMVEVRSRKAGQNIDVYTLIEGNKIGGLAMIATDPKQLIVVNIVGPIDIEKLADLEGNFGIPKIEIVRDKKVQEK
jgi:hypothetical protein